MHDQAEISVVIPVFNAAPYLSFCIQSVCQFTMVKQVVVVDDGSSDDSYALAQRLSATDPRIEVYTHPERINQGAGPTRNVGIQKCRHPWIAFLDADDWWLPHRFDRTLEVLQQHEDADGVYECLGIHFESAEVETKWKRRHGYVQTTLTQEVAPEQLIFSMAPFGQLGWFSGDALLVRKDLLLACGMYSDLRLSQDTELYMKLAIKGSLYPGNLHDPVAIRRVHDNNRISGDTETFYKYRLELWERFIVWCRQEKVSAKLRRKSMWQWMYCSLVYVRFIPSFQLRLSFLLRTFRKMWTIAISRNH